MTHPFEIELHTELPATREQVWDAIATGPRIDSWFIGRNEVEPQEGGRVTMETGNHREQSEATAHDAGTRFATRTAPAADGRFMAFDHLVEGRDGALCCTWRIAGCSATTGTTSTTRCAAAGRSTSTPCVNSWPTSPAAQRCPSSPNERFAVHAADAIYTFHHRPHVALMFHHLFGPTTDSAEAASRRWLTKLLG